MSSFFLNILLLYLKPKIFSSLETVEEILKQLL
jgi:hypothetical protein